ncbi:MAG: formate/nitrite transporter family protein [Bacteroidales bacterium]|nr:formate/nitrite transporter family protein [Anaerotignum sp.]MCI5679544.1 formate/nitrite transporter family protein [Bacteroidales bacterium]MDY3926997.1 formate/nitrite transporter family protein [Anaerotignum sp.]
MERVRQFFSAILAGMLIGMGGTVFLSQSNPVVGSFLFAIGLFTIVVFQLHLFTGKVGYTPFQKPVYLIELAITWLGNLVGTGITACMVRNSRIYEGMAERVAGIAEVKLADNFLSLFLLAIFCGMLMFIAVDCFRNVQGSTLRFIGVFIPVMVFILSGFEHVIANMFYFSLAGAWSAHCLAAIIVMTLGNAVGGMLIPVYLKVFKIR